MNRHARPYLMPGYRHARSWRHSSSPRPRTLAFIVFLILTLIAALASYGAQVLTLTINEEVSEEIFEATALPGEKSGTAGKTTTAGQQASAIPGHKAYPAPSAGAASASPQEKGEVTEPPK